MVKDNEVVIGSNNSSQMLAESKKSKNYQISIKFKKSNYQPKSSEFKKAILDKSEILVNLTVVANTNAMRYFTSEAREIFTWLGQAFIEALILQNFDLECYI